MDAKSEIEEKLKQIVAGVLNLPLGSVNDNLSRESNPTWDSFNNLMLFSTIEKEMGLSFNLEELEQIINFKDLCKIVYYKKNETPQSS